MSGAHSRSQSPWLFNHPESSSNNAHAHSPTTPFTFRLPSLRYPGDGLDLRRPVMSQPSQDVIDLTEEPDSPPLSRNAHNSTTLPQPPRFSQPAPFQQDIIDIDDDENRSFNRPRGSSPEIQLLYSRSIPQEARQQRRQPGDASYARHLQADAGRIGRFSEASRAPHLPTWHDLRTMVRTARGDIGRSATQVLNDEANMRRHLGLGRTNHLPRTPRAGEPLDLEVDFSDAEELFLDQPGRSFAPPAHLNFFHTGFQIEPPPQRAPPPPTYNAPPPPRKGFTRSPKEDDTLICPNCEEELGVGKDEIKRQVWVVKSCGHVCLRPPPASTPRVLSSTNKKSRSIVANAQRTEPAEVKRKRCARHAPSLSQSVRSMDVQNLAVLPRRCFKSIYDRGRWRMDKSKMNDFCF